MITLVLVFRQSFENGSIIVSVLITINVCKFEYFCCWFLKSEMELALKIEKCTVSEKIQKMHLHEQGEDPQQ